MIWLYGILGYIIIPFIVYPINDWFAGYYHHKTSKSMSIYNSEDMIFTHGLWPLILLVLPVGWIYNLNKDRIDNFKLGKKLSKIYTIAEAKRKKEMDLDYQAEKWLLGKKDDK